MKVFESKNRIQYVNQNVMSVIRFYSGPVRFTLGRLDRIDKTILQHLTKQGMLMKRGMATSRLYMKPDNMGMGLKSCIGVYLVMLIRLLLKYKWGTILISEWFWRMEELTKRNGKGVWLREIEKTLKRFDTSLEWLMERASLRDGEMDKIGQNCEMEVHERKERLRMERLKSIDEVLEEVNVLIDTHFFNEFAETKSSQFLKKVLANQSSIDMNLLKRTWKKLNCSPKTLKEIREIQENLLCVGKRQELLRKGELRQDVGAARQGFL